MSNIKTESPRDEDELPHGEWIGYWDNGQLWYCHNYVHGIKHGLHEGYRYDGSVNYRGYWNMDIPIGYWYYYEQKKYFLWLI